MRPTGQLHLGNYHGALKNWVELQYQYECYFFVADWHALTTGYEDTKQLPKFVHEMLIDWLAAGLNPGVVHAVRAVAGARARRTAPAAVDDHAAGLAGARAELQGPAGGAQGKGSRHLRLPRLPAAADRGHPAVPPGLRAGGRGPGGARGDHARDRAPLQPSVRPRAGLRNQGRERHQAARRPQQHHVQAAAQEIPGERRPARARQGAPGGRPATTGSRWPIAKGC